MKTHLTRIVFSAALSLTIGLVACDGGTDDADTKADDTSTTTTTTTNGDGDGDPPATESSGGDDSSCPVGTFDCPCGADDFCVAGLECSPADICALDGSGGSGEPTSAEGSGTAEPPEPGAYDPAECEAPSEILSVEDMEGEFCSAPCVLDEDCPAGPVGTTASCSISTKGGEPNHCTLLCEPVPDGEDCPEGSTCKPVPQQPVYGLCTY